MEKPPEKDISSSITEGPNGSNDGLVQKIEAKVINFRPYYQDHIPEYIELNRLWESPSGVELRKEMRFYSRRKNTFY